MSLGVVIKRADRSNSLSVQFSKVHTKCVQGMGNSSYDRSGELKNYVYSKRARVV